MPREPETQIDLKARERVRVKLGEDYWNAVRLMMNIRSDIWHKLEGARHRLAEIDAMLASH